uniref:Periplasmic heavy metal sensor n=1 Tax=Globodera pallida TaxID=36090 RepID=A0A183CKL7_GLOPA
MCGSRIYSALFVSGFLVCMWQAAIVQMSRIGHYHGGQDPKRLYDFRLAQTPAAKLKRRVETLIMELRQERVLWGNLELQVERLTQQEVRQWREREAVAALQAAKRSRLEGNMRRARSIIMRGSPLSMLLLLDFICEQLLRLWSLSPKCRPNPWPIPSMGSWRRPSVAGHKRYTTKK